MTQPSVDVFCLDRIQGGGALDTASQSLLKLHHSSNSAIRNNIKQKNLLTPSIFKSYFSTKVCRVKLYSACSKMAESLHVLMTNIERSISNLTQEFKRVQSLVWNQTKPEECDAASTVSTDGGNLMTPSTTASEASDTTTRGEDMTVTVLPVEFGPPEKGKTYIIRTRNDKKVLTILKGDLQVVKGYAFGGWLWECSDWNGWYRFRNCTSGEYLGIDGDELAARPVSLTAHFTPRYRADGGYILLYKYYEVLHTVCCQDDGSRLARSGETAVWEFIEAKYPPIAEFPY